MFTVIPNTRSANLFLLAALAILAVTLLTLSVYPAISAPKQVALPVTGNVEIGADYYQRHPELRLWAPTVPDMTADFALRHPEWIFSVQNAAIPLTGSFEGSDYFFRHPELRTPNTTMDLSDYFLRH
jgi:hypothetical protein